MENTENINTNKTHPIHNAASCGNLHEIKILVGNGVDIGKSDNDGCTPLHDAAFNGHLDVVMYLLTNGAKVNQGDNEGVTPLHAAAQNGHLEVVTYLLTHGADVKQGRNDGTTPIYLAAMSGHLHVVSYLHEYGAEVGKSGEKGKAPLRRAAFNGHLDVVTYLLTNGAKVNQGDNKGFTPLICAAQNGHLEVVRYLLTHGADVNQGKNDGATPIHFAALEGHLHVVSYLHEYGAEVDKRDEKGYTPLRNAAFDGHLDVVTYLLTNGVKVNQVANNGATPLLCAAQNGHLEAVKYLLTHGADVNQSRNDGTTPIYLAAMSGHLHVVSYLHEYGAEMDKSGEEGYTPLLDAAFNGHLDVVTYLLTNGAKVNQGDNNGATPLSCTAQNGYLEVVKYLLTHGADVNQGRNDGRIAIHLAALEGHLHVVSYLHEYGVDVDKSGENGFTPLQHAAFDGHLDVVTYLLTNGAKVNQGDNEGFTPLHAAAQNGHLEVVKCLLTHGADVNQVRNDGTSSIHLAALEGHLHVVSYLHGHGADVDKMNEEGYTPLRDAAFDGHLDVVKYLITNGAKVNKGDNKGFTPLHLAAQNGHLEVVKYLHTHGADVNQGSNDGATPIYLAALKGHLHVVSCLHEHGADVGKRTENGFTPLRNAAFDGHLDVVTYLLTNGAKVNQGDNEGFTPLHAAAQNGHLEVVKCLHTHGADVNQSSNDGATPIYLAAMDGHLHVVSCLHEDGADVDKGDENGFTPLRNAAFYGHLDVVTYLLTNGAKVNQGDNEGYTPLHLAAQNCHLEVVKYLHTHGADVNQSSNDGTSPIYLAAMDGHLHVVSYLHEHGADVEKSGEKGKAPLRRAAFNGHLDVVTYLLTNGAKVNQGDNKGFTPLYLAVTNGHLKVVTYLLSHGADVNQGINIGWTPLHTAANHCHVDMVEILLNNGADVNKNEYRGRIPLHLAASKGYLELATLLHNHGARINTRDNKGVSPLRDAANGGHVEVVAYLLGHGALVNEVKGEDCSHLWRCVHTGLREGKKKSAGLILQHLEQHRERQCDSLDEYVNARYGDGYTLLHVAIQQGFTSLVGQLLRLGADVNIQSENGQTCLHLAIIMCYQHHIQVEDTSFLNSISRDLYNGSLDSAKALVFYLLDNGARYDIRDKSGYLPIQYARDETVRQMLLWRIPTATELQEIRASTSKQPISIGDKDSIVGSVGKELNLGQAISMLIPPHAVEEGKECRITLAAVGDKAPSGIHNDESVACYGIRCDPANLRFKCAVRITLPHSAAMVNPEAIRPDIIAYVQRSANGPEEKLDIKRTKSSSPEALPYCKVGQNHLELFVDYCAEWWVLLPLEQHDVRQQFVCTPYIPNHIDDGKGFDIVLVAANDLPESVSTVGNKQLEQAYRKAHRPVSFDVGHRSGDVVFTCNHGDTKLGCERSPCTGPKGLNGRTFKFSVPGGHMSKHSDLVTVNIEQQGKFGMSKQIAFIVRYKDDVCASAAADVEAPTVRMRLPDHPSCHDSPDSDLNIYIVEFAENLDVNKFYDLGVALGFSLQQLDNMEYSRFRDRQQATIDMLMRWKKNQHDQEHKVQMADLLSKIQDQIEDTCGIIFQGNSSASGEIADSTLLKVANLIPSSKFAEVGSRLGFTQTQLAHIEHRTIWNRKDANIQMLKEWKASQSIGPETARTLKCVWDSVMNAPNDLKAPNSPQAPLVPRKPRKAPPVVPKKITGSSKEEVIVSAPSSHQAPLVPRKPRKAPPVPPEKMTGTSKEEVIVSAASFDPTSLLPRDRLKARPVASKKFTRTGEEEVIVTGDTPVESVRSADWLDKAGGSPTSDELSAVCSALTNGFSVWSLGRSLGISETVLQQSIGEQLADQDLLKIRLCSLRMLEGWVESGGRREALLIALQTHDLTDPANRTAKAMMEHPGYRCSIAYAVLDSHGGLVEGANSSSRMSVPANAIPKGRRVLVTMRTPGTGTRFPLKEGESQVTPVVQLSPLGYRLHQTACISLPHCIDLDSTTDVPQMFVYAEKEKGTYSRQRLISRSPAASKIANDEIAMDVDQLHSFVISARTEQGLKLKCICFHPLYMPADRRPELHVYLVRNLPSVEEDICEDERWLPHSFSQARALKELCFTSAPGDISIRYVDGDKTDSVTISAQQVYQKEMLSRTFDIDFSTQSNGQKQIRLEVQQGLQEVTAVFDIAIEGVENEVALSPVPGQLNEPAAIGEVTKLDIEIVDKCLGSKFLKLAFKLGFSHSVAVKYQSDYNNGGETSSGCRQMLLDWRRRIRPSRQLAVLKTALEELGKEHIADMLQKESSRSDRRQASFREKQTFWEKNMPSGR